MATPICANSHFEFSDWGGEQSCSAFSNGSTGRLREDHQVDCGRVELMKSRNLYQLINGFVGLE